MKAEVNEDLIEVAAQIKAMGYLLERHDDLATPLDISTINWGIGLILDGAAEKIMMLARQIEAQGMRKVKRKTKRDLHKRSLSA